MSAAHAPASNSAHPLENHSTAPANSGEKHAGPDKADIKSVQSYTGAQALRVLTDMVDANEQKKVVEKVELSNGERTSDKLKKKLQEQAANSDVEAAIEGLFAKHQKKVSEPDTEADADANHAHGKVEQKHAQEHAKEDHKEEVHDSKDEHPDAEHKEHKDEHKDEHKEHGDKKKHDGAHAEGAHAKESSWELPYWGGKEMGMTDAVTGTWDAIKETASGIWNLPQAAVGGVAAIPLVGGSFVPWNKVGRGIKKTGIFIVKTPYWIGKGILKTAWFAAKAAAFGVMDIGSGIGSLGKRFFGLFKKAPAAGTPPAHH